MNPIERQQLQTILSQGLQDLRLSADGIEERLLNYLELLAKWNRVYNLSAIKIHEEMVVLHLLDSLSIVPFVKGSRIIDIGTGAGLPGIPLALYFPQKQFVLLDSNNKKTRFLIQAVAELNISNASVVQSRAESMQDTTGFDCVLTRAFAPLNAMITPTQHLCASKGRMLAMCGAYPSADQLKYLSLLSTWRYEIYPLHVPQLQAQRHLIVLERIQCG